MLHPDLIADDKEELAGLINCPDYESWISELDRQLVNDLDAEIAGQELWEEEYQLELPLVY